MNKIRVLFLAANPLGTSKLDLDEEMRLIDEKVYASEWRDQLELVAAWAARPDDLLQSLNRYQPQVVHFSGHGTQTGELQFVGNDGFPRPVSTQALTAVFKTFKNTTRLIILNACYSKVQAEALRQEIACIVGMNAAIGETTARTFAASFYRAIGFGRSIQDAFEQGKSALLLESIAEDATPELLVRPGTDPNSIVLLGAHTSEASLLQDPFRLADTPLHYFTDIETFLDAEGRWFQRDYEQGRIYAPQKEYFAEIERILQAKKRVLLVGRAAAGKTVLALAFAKHLQQQAHYRIGYKDVKQAEPGDGRKWYALAQEHDRPGILYILDNCHLAPKEVDEFFRQWKNQSPLYAQCLLISRANAQETSLDESSYFSLFTADEKVHVRSENIYLQVIEQYVATLQQQSSDYENPLASDDLVKLEKQHAHNLVVSRSRLDVWKTRGLHAHLSDIRQEDLYQALEAKYFSVYGPALATLCVLQRYEVRAHTFFVRKLPQDEVKQLQQEKLLIHFTVAGYGQLYDLVLHPNEARELFLAHVFNQYGQVTQENIQQLVTSTLKAYLSVKPSNYITLYDSLARQKDEDILKQLLLDRDLQTSTADQFSRETLVDAIRYVYKVAKFDHESGAYLIKRVVHVASIHDICSKLLKSSFHDITVLLQSMKYIDAELAHTVVDTVAMKQLASRRAEETIQDLFRLLRTLRDTVPAQATLLLASLPIEELVAKTTARNFPDMVKRLQTYEYPDAQLAHFVNLLDMRQFVHQFDDISSQSLFWTLRALEKISLRQAHTLLRLLPLRELATKASVSNIGSLDQIMQLMQRVGYTREQMSEFSEMLDVEQVAVRAKQGNLRRFASLLRTIRAVSVSTAVRLLEAVTPAEMAKLFHNNDTSLDDLEQVRKASTRAFWEAFIHHCSAQDIAELFQHTSLGTVGTFFSYQHAFHRVQEGYTLFEKQFLPARLATEPLNKIGELLDHLLEIPQKGQRLAHNALDLLIKTDIVGRIASSNLLHFALLLHHARSIDATSLPSLLAPLRQPAVLQKAFAISDVQGTQLFIFNVANIDAEYVDLLQQGLQNSNGAEKLEDAPIKDIGLLLWNIYRYIDKNMAQQYSLYVDARLRTPRLREALPEDLCFFLWNLTSILSYQQLQTFHHPEIVEILQTGWSSEIGWSMVLLGIATLAEASAMNGVYLQSISVDENALAQWFTMKKGGHNPYFLALALRGLQWYDEHVAPALVRTTLSLSDARRLLQAATSSAITAYSILLLEEAMRWIEMLLREE